MINIAVVEDNEQDAAQLCAFIDEYAEKNGLAVKVSRFSDAVSFLDGTRGAFDLIFMDILMPGMDGMRAAQRLRASDRWAKLIFVTNMAQFAVKGYSVDALDFMVKPVVYRDFEMKMRKAVGLIRAEEGQQVAICSGASFLKVPAREITYVEISGHNLCYHMADGQTVRAVGTLSKVEEQLKACRFLRCNSCYLVNPRSIASVDGYEIKLYDGDVLQISHPRKKKFMSELAAWIGEGNFV